MLDKHSPIGIIDSGIGGYSVARRLQNHLPHEDFLYLGDGANTPYGNHSAQEILHMTRRLLQFMAQRRWPATPSPAWRSSSSERWSAPS